MILNYFKGKNIIIQFGLIAVLIAAIFSQEIILLPPNDFGPLYDLIFDLLKGNSLFIYITYIVILISQGLILQMIISRFNLITRNNFIVLFIWLLLILSNTAIHSLNPILIVAPVCSWALYKLFSVSEIENALPQMFSVGFLFSLASLIYGNILWFLPFIFISLVLMRLFKGRHVLASLIGFLLPFLYLWAYGFVFDKEIEAWNYYNFQFENWNLIYFGEIQWILTIKMLLILMISVFGVFSVMLNLFSKLIQVRNLTSILFLMLLLSVALQFFANSWWLAHPIIIFIPLSILLSMFLSEQKKTLYVDLILLSIIGMELLEFLMKKYA